jgi:hypothetical protein
MIPMSAPRIDAINIVVGDVGSAAEFLNALGVDLAPAPPGWEAHHRAVPSATSSQRGHHPAEPTFGIDLDSSAFAHEWGGLDPSYTGVVVNLRVDEPPDVDRVHELGCSVGGRSLKAPYDAFWGSRFALLEGPGPLVVGIMSVPDDARRTAPPDLHTLE